MPNIDILKDYGLPVFLVIFFLWKDWRNDLARAISDKAINDRLVSLNTYQKEKLESVVERNIVVMERTLNELTGVNAALNRLTDIVSKIVISNKDLQASNEDVVKQAKEGNIK